MPLFDYIALEPTAGGRRQGTIDAPSKQAAEAKLIEEGLSPLSIEPLKESANVEDIMSRFKEIKSDTIVIFTRQLATMIDSGMSPLKSLEVLEEQEQNVKFRNVISQIIGRLETGITMHEAFGDHPQVFDTLYISMLEAGEASGSLPESLDELAIQLEKAAKLRKAVKSATIYPKVVLVVAFLILSGLMMTIVPRFANLFEEIVASTYSPSSGEPPPSTDLPVLTQIVTNISYLLYPKTENRDLAWWGEVAIRFGVFFVLFILIRKGIKYALRQPGPRKQWDAYKFRAPMKIGPLIQKIVTARFARTYSALLVAGVPQQKALEIVANTSGNVLVAEAVLKARDQMMAGSTISEPLARAEIFPPMVVRMIEVGEKTGRLELMLGKIADFFEEEVELQIKGLTSLIEPLMIMIVGGAVGLVIISVYLPLFGIYDKIGTNAAITIHSLANSVTQLLGTLPF